VLRGIISAVAAILVVYLVIVYVVVPWAWRRHLGHPAISTAPRFTHTGIGIQGDALNIALVASEEQIHLAMHAAGWYPADPITLRSALEIAGSTVFRRPYDDAPVSNLYLFGRKEDLAYEQPVGHDARRRHHVRFWRCDELDDQGRPLWIGAATFDMSVGFSHTTGQITHHIGPDIDAERDKLLADLEAAGAVTEAYWVDGFQQQTEGHNGGGDPYHTDRRLAVAVLGGEPRQATPPPTQP
jgi:hypothetical protein